MKSDLKLIKWDGMVAWQLTIDDEFKQTMGKKPVCQHCKGPIGVPFYLCETTKKWFCAECSLKEGDISIQDEICRGFLKDKHKHFCIRKIVEEEKDEKE